MCLLGMCSLRVWSGCGHSRVAVSVCVCVCERERERERENFRRQGLLRYKHYLEGRLG